MCLLNEKDLKKIVKDKKRFALFDLPERERTIIMMHAKGVTFEHIAALHKISLSRAQQLHEQGRKRMRDQLLQSLEEKIKRQSTKPTGIFIGGEGEAWYNGENIPAKFTLLRMGLRNVV